ncbi:MAG: porin [Bradyrhizobiaceae bacterium]|nr:MAG: porin [Bradyrhizobiaceae bacterium]
MSKIKSLVLGSAAGLVAIGGAQAADLPVKAKAVEYVKVCSLYGAGFYYIPGTDTCLRIGGYVRAEYNFNSGNSDAPSMTNTYARNGTWNNTRARIQLQFDARTATEWGVVRAFAQVNPQFSTGDQLTNNDVNRFDFAFIQFAGFTFGRSASAYALPWNANPGNNLTSFLMGGPNFDGGVWNVQYTWQFGNGFSATVGVDEQSESNRVGLINATNGLTVFNGYTNWYNGVTSSTGANQAVQGYYGGAVDVVGNLKLDQAWGLIQVSGAAHQVRSNYLTDGTASPYVVNAPADKWGYAVNLGLQIKNLPTGPGDDIKFTVGYTEGALRYIMGSSNATPRNIGLFGGSDSFKFATAPIADGVIPLVGNEIQLTKGFGLNGGFNHYWNANWSSSVFGSYTKIDYNDTAAASLGTAWAAAAKKLGTFTGTYNPDFNIAQVGVVTSWTPVKGLTFSGEALYTNVDGSTKGTLVAGTGPVAGHGPGTYTIGSQDIWSGSLRVQRNF